MLLPVEVATKFVEMPGQIAAGVVTLCTVGKAIAVPLAATFAVVAPVEVRATLPDGVPVAPELIRT